MSYSSEPLLRKPHPQRTHAQRLGYADTISNSQEQSGIWPRHIAHCPLFINMTLLPELLPVGAQMGWDGQRVTGNSFLPITGILK